MNMHGSAMSALSQLRVVSCLSRSGSMLKPAWAIFIAAFFFACAAQGHAANKYIIVPLPNVSTPAIGVYLINGCESAGSTNGSVTIIPKHGTATPEAVSFSNPGCPGSSFPGVEVYYKWKDTSGMPGSGSDAFHAHFDTSLGPVDYDVFISEGGSQRGNGKHDPAPTAPICITCIYLEHTTEPLSPTDNPPNDASSTISSDGQATAGAPINVATGNVFYGVTDYTTAGANPLFFTRYYNSLATITGFAVGTGRNWRTNYDRYLDLLNSGVVAVERPDGQVLAFFNNGITWVPESDVDYTLFQSGTDWVLKCPDDSVETYSQIIFGTLESTVAQLNSIESRNGYTQKLTYSNPFELKSVTDSYGRSLTFTYSGGLRTSMTTPDGNEYSYSYNANKTLASVASPVDTGSATYRYVYESASLPMALTGIKDRYGDRLYSWSYDLQGRGLTSSRGATGVDASLVTLSYGTNSTAVTNALGVTDTYDFTLLQGVNKISQVNRAATSTTAAATRTLSYDKNGYLASLTDWNGNQTSYVNNADGLPTNVTEAAGSGVARTVSLTYDSTWSHLPNLVTTAGVTIGYTYDRYGEPLTRTMTDTTANTAPYSTNGQTRAWTFSWSNGLLASAKSPNGNTTSYSYTGGTLTKVTNPLGQATSITSYTDGGYPKTVVDPNGVTATISYDGEMRPVNTALTTSFGVLTTTYKWRFANYLSSVVRPDGSAMTYPADTALRRIGQIDSDNNDAQFTLDALGNRTAANIYDPASKLTWQHSATFDALGRVLTDVGGAGQTSTYTHDNNGNTLTYKDGLNHATTQSFDGLDRLMSRTDANGGVATLSYDAYDRPLSATDQNGNTTRYVYDGFGDVVQQISPDSGVTVYRYDADANLTQKLDAASVITNHSYDALDRILTSTYPANPVENVAFTYDEAAHGFGIGRLTSMTDRVGTLSRSYDERGNLLKETRADGFILATVGYTYDPASRIASMTYPSGSTVTYSRDAAGQVTKIAIPKSTVASGITHLPFGPANAFTYGNGITDTRSFDLDYRMTGLADSAGGSALQSLGYAYDLANNVSSIKDSVRPYLSQTFGYDVLNRLTTAAAADYGSFAWGYDKLGNRMTESRGAFSPTTGYVYTPGSNQLASLSVGGVTMQNFSYTPTGNTAGVSEGGSLVAGAAYNNDNRLQSSSGYGQYLAGYGYDGFGQRLAKLIPGTTPTGTLFQYGQDGSLLEEADLTGIVKADYIYLDGMPIGDFAPASSSLYYLHTDHLGTPQGATDSTKNPVWAATYYPFGGTNYLAGTITQNLRLPGMYFDVETQSYHNGFRDYAPTVGRYAETDPIGLSGGMNTYAYVGLNPKGRVDAKGLYEGDYFCDKTGLDCGPRPAALPITLSEAADNIAGMALDVALICLPELDAAKLGSLLEDEFGGIRIGGNFSRSTKQGAKDIAGGRCRNCGVETTPGEKSQRGVTPPGTEGQTDHILPRSKGGTNDPANAQHLCRECNIQKSDKLQQ